MESYVNLLSPIENISFTYNANPNTTHSTDSACKPSSPQTSTHIYSSTPSNGNALEDQWNGLLQGPQLENFDMNHWNDMQLYPEFDYTQNLRARMFGTVSDSFTDSPATTSSSVFSSATCSPWETCPALAPASPELRAENFGADVDNMQNSQVFLSPEHIQALVLEDLTLSPLRPSVCMPFHDAGMTGSFQQMASHPAPIDTSGVLNNALVIDFSGNETPVAARRETDFNLSSGDGQPNPANADGPSHSPGPYFSSPASNDFPLQTAESTENNTSPGEGFASETLLTDRAARRKSVRLVFSDDDEEYVEDSDDDYEDEGLDDDSPRKRRRGSPKSLSERSNTSSDYDDERRGSPSSRRSGMKGSRRSLSIGDKKVGAVSKRKTKRRHYCPREGCQSSFTRYTDMERHLATVHRPTDTEANKCAFCRKAFSRDDAVLRHENDSCPMRPKKRRSGNNIWL